MADAEPSLNIPSLLTLAVFSFFVIRWFFGRNGAISSNDAAQRHGGGRRIDPAHVEQLAQMFPQLDRRDIMWDMQRNGGSMAATTERVLSGRGLDTPPPSFQPQLPAPSPPATQASSASRSTFKPQAQDLISRYNLSDRVKSESPQTVTSTSSGTIIHQESAWSQNRTERQRLLQKRRDEMILAARRKLQEKDRTTEQ
ncbi:protein neuralized [[Emmonsia] crescens]|uniref:Coupling of ubiquitin conjugation to ER degradation protein 1 n=1 Tax=[Emmonsia] crescens TaxID=73230 RepID=A0A0G2I0F0_9EURO|nr:protein neuralized [Emmonsia crescens UAMH 3008]